jgi:hypothetical protein
MIILRRPPNPGRSKEAFMVTKSSALRDNIFALLQDSNTSVEEDLQALAQCTGHIRNRRIIGDLARESGLTLGGFLSNDALELYYDIERGRHNLGYIAKGWQDPGFRIGDLVEIGWWDKDVLKTNTPQIMRCCATNGITLTIQEAPLAITLQLDGVIYSEGFNRATFLQTLDSLYTCVGKIHSLIPGDGQGGSLSPSSAPSFRGLTEASGRFH